MINRIPFCSFSFLIFLFILSDVSLSASFFLKDSALLELISDHNDASPFGVHNPKVPDRPEMSPHNPGQRPFGYDLPAEAVKAGFHWARYCGFEGLVWDLVETRPGIYDWSRTDYLFTEAWRAGLRLIVVIHCFNRLDSPYRAIMGGGPSSRKPANMKSYLKWLAAAIERYDGDGVDDAPGSPIINHWEVENEVETVFWNDSPQNYARLLIESSDVIRKANPKAEILIAGTAGPGWINGKPICGLPQFYLEILDTLESEAPGRKIFDIFNYHVYFDMASNTEFIADHLREIRRQLKKYGYDNYPVWCTETGTYSGRPLDMEGKVRVPLKSERVQAFELLRIYLGALSEGVGKVFWCTLTEWHAFGGVEDTIWDNIGLIHNPANHGRSYPKLAYFTLQNFSRLYEERGWTEGKRILRSSPFFIFCFQGEKTEKTEKTKKPGAGDSWIVWPIEPPSGPGFQNVPIDGSAGTKYRVTELLPAPVSGDFGNTLKPVFREAIITAEKNGDLKLFFGDSPLLVDAL
ncbi:MAG: hypothetical protein CVV64_20200 [Candidatus Wallbacteria bacterium HGW-Wallbacteria-1]|jgi:hypothetical protein|uniref:Glycoside hydrolase family 5 domain-containing protein n=1 Tax=Candidatus Wallbacteria bacterium HGW-Wallbacteria-1 TaxID=2013854 RepID=A0A2N1PII8_9BACT|nr:MAG: hypothetical protein CVV64_20200 [Candidatus Wallbacteria bacterium HGW-Wallbacteria-1]